MSDIFKLPKRGRKKDPFALDISLFPSQEEKKKRGYIHKADRIELWKRQKGKCAICKNDLDPHTYHVDHKKTVAQKGKTNLSNLQLLCANCHAKKTIEDRKKQAVSKKRKKKKKDPFNLPIKF